ncbi:hypothetical protein CN187_08995 [Sinorhizobium meliloti]|uniref:hypothetical protein n=1 Tax=Rhizobium meliloti TaxID=382 RepID=UPI000FDC27C6|nr:hypothetical protein [Sinorhizobium meliloti]RVI69329.1 hypothetical protein CN187_08995 [Sinorhizobium meliloti]RVO67033.1 hypothetical protein CN094_01180 [Sinorhizobium meliloti]
MPLDYSRPLPPVEATPISRYEMDAINAQLLERKILAYGAVGLALLLVIAFLYRKQIAAVLYSLAIYISAIGLRLLRRTRGAASTFANDVQKRAEH